MIGYFRDKLISARLKARYERAVQQQLVDLLEESRPTTVAEDPGDWTLLGGSPQHLTGEERAELRDQARKLVRENPHARNILRLLEAYVVGEGLRLSFRVQNESRNEPERKKTELLKKLWIQFLEANKAHFSFQEYARRVWRDGECFLRIYADTNGPPQVRFIDPEWIGATSTQPDSQGIETEQGDVETVRYYLKIDPKNGELIERIPANEILHSRIGVDSNEKRGISFFASMLYSLNQFQQWQETELRARKLQSSIVLWRKVQGGPAQASAMAQAAKTGTLPGVPQDVNQEQVRPGTILTTSAGTEIKFLQPDTNFGDAVPLGRMLLLGIASGAGIPEFMLTADASNGNYASTMVAEGPAVKLFQCEQNYFCGEFERLWKRLMQEAVFQNQLDEETLQQAELHWSKPELISRDRPRERQADVALINAKVLSRAAVQRKENLDPQQMQREIDAESETVVRKTNEP